MTILAGNRRLRLKEMLRDPKFWVKLILNVIGVRLRSIGTHFDHNRCIIRIFIFGVFYRSPWSHAKVSDPLYRGFRIYFFRKLLFEFVVSNPYVLEVGEKIKSKFPNISPLPTFRPLWIDLVRWLYSWRKLGSWIAFFLSFLLSSVNVRVASEIQGMGYFQWKT